MKLARLIKIAVSCGVCLLSGFLGSFFTNPNMGWYQTLSKPFFNPPGWVFAPVWTILYLLMGVAAFLVWDKGLDKPQIKAAIRLFLVQLLFNVIWTPIFFGLQMPLAGLVDIVLLWAAILLTIISFSKISPTAAVMLIPYILWVSFAAILNASICLLNR